jgi:hypothetical protein
MLVSKAEEPVGVEGLTVPHIKGNLKYGAQVRVGVHVCKPTAETLKHARFFNLA